VPVTANGVILYLHDKSLLSQETGLRHGTSTDYLGNEVC